VTTTREAAAAQTTSPATVASASFIGTTVDHYDLFIYGTAATLLFPELHFPYPSPLVGTPPSFATFGVGFLARPVGGAVFGHFGDRVGRKKMLLISMVTMGAATVLMRLMPTYATIGLAAPILLTVPRLVQGLAVGGEWGGATLIAVEHTPTARGPHLGLWRRHGSGRGRDRVAVQHGLHPRGPLQRRRHARQRLPGCHSGNRWVQRA
jgi:MFS family permease